MAKNKKTKTDKKNNDKINLLLRKVHAKSLNILIDECINTFSREVIMEVINEMKNVFYTMDKREVEGLINDIYFMEILNYTEELFWLIYTNKFNLTNEVEFYRKKIVDMHKNHNLRFEMYIYVNKIGVLFENDKIYPKNKGHYFRLVAKAITDIMFTFYQYTITYTLKIKNQKMREFIKKDDNIEIKYDSVYLISPEILDSIYTSLIIGSPMSEKQITALESINKSLHRIYSNFMSKDINPEFFEENKGFLGLNKNYNLPIVNSEKKLISFDELSRIPEGRKYAFSKAGVRFEFLNKQDNIDYIDMVENSDSICFNVFIINNGGFFVTNKVYHGSEWMSEDKIKDIKDKDINPITSNLIRIPFYIRKDDLKNATTFEDKLRAISCIGYSVIPNNENIINFAMGLNILILCCIYSAYYDLNIFKSSIRMFNKSSIHKCGYNRNSGFRVAHLKRLPKGSKASDEAKLNAKKEGIDSIPDGYTFVRASFAIDTEPTKKIIKIS